MDLDAFRAGLDGWLDEHAAELAAGPGNGGLDEHVAQLAKVKRLLFDAGWMRWGWPERVGGLGGSSLCRAYLGEALTTRGLVDPGIVLDDRGAGPDDDRLRRARAGGDHGAAAAARRGAVVPGVLGAGHGQQPGCPAMPRDPRGRRAGGSAGRRSGRASRSTPNAACCSPGPARPTPRTAASPRCSSTWTARGSPCARCSTMNGVSRSSPRSSSTTCRCRSSGRSARSTRAGRSRWSCCRTSAAPRCGTAARSCTAGCSCCSTALPAGEQELDPYAVGEVATQLYAFRARSRETQHRLAAGEPARAGDVDRQGAAGHGRAGRLRPGRGRGWPRSCCSGDDPASGAWRADYLYSRAATIYGGSAEIQRNIIARRLLDLGADR